MNKGIDFIKVHAGWDECIFLYGDQVPDGKELEVGLSLLQQPSIRGTEVGILYKPEVGGDIKVKMLDATSKEFIRMCGGLTQSLGKAVVETGIARHFNIKIQEPEIKFVLETEIGPIPIRVDVINGIARKVTTDMRSYMEDCYKNVKAIRLGNLKAINVGAFLVLDVDMLGEQFPGIDFWSRQRASLDILEQIYRKFLQQEGLLKDSCYGILYQVDSDSGRHVQAVFRFFPWAYCPQEEMEFSCGTGTIAIGIAMVERGQVHVQDGIAEISLIVGGTNIPSELRARTELKMNIQKARVVSAEFSHSMVEIVASGKVYLPT